MWEKKKITFDTEKLRNFFRKENLLVMVLLGILLFVIAIPVEKESRKQEETTLKTLQSEKKGDAADFAAEDISYTEQMEERLKKILSEMEGVGEVEVMITLKASEEKIVEKEKQISHSSTTEQDAQGGSRTVSNSENNPKVVYRTEGSVSDPYVVKTYSPEIEGVLVVAAGAGSGTVDRTISGIVQALFDVEAHKVKVVKMENNGS